jgi:hypothetical protein
VTAWNVVWAVVALVAGCVSLAYLVGAARRLPRTMSGECRCCRRPTPKSDMTGLPFVGGGLCRPCAAAIAQRMGWK